MGKRSTMSIRSKEDIRESMVAKGIITTEGNINEKAMVDNARKSVAESAEILKTTSKTKTKKVTSKKNVLFLEGLSYTAKEKMFDKAMVDIYGDTYNSERGYVKLDLGKEKPVYVNVQISEMKIRSDRTENTSGLRVYMVKRGNSYSIGEYAGKISMDRVAKRIKIIADAE